MDAVAHPGPAVMREVHYAPLDRDRDYRLPGLAYLLSKPLQYVTNAPGTPHRGVPATHPAEKHL